MRLSKKTVVRNHVVYMPHAAMPDEEVATVHEVLDDALRAARARKYINLIAGDFNAEVGTIQDGDDCRIIGSTPMTHRSERGNWLLQWCTLRQLKLSNTFGSHDLNLTWTYKNAGTLKLIDYMLVDICFAKRFANAKVLTSLDTGSDHRPLIVGLTFGDDTCRRRNKHKKPKCTWVANKMYAEK